MPNFQHFAEAMRDQFLELCTQMYRETEPQVSYREFTIDRLAEVILGVVPALRLHTTPEVKAYFDDLANHAVLLFKKQIIIDAVKHNAVEQLIDLESVRLKADGCLISGEIVTRC